MKKKIIAVTLAMTLVMGSGALPSGVFENVVEKTSITASAVKVSGKFKYEISKDGTVSIEKYTGSATAVTIPSKIGGKRVTSISGMAFIENKRLKSIKIPNSIKIIGAYAFCGCESLTSLTIPSSVTTIGFEAFSGCKSLKSLIISKGVKVIEYDAFYGCTSLKSVKIPNSVKSIDCMAFQNCKSLTTVTISSSVTSIEDATFQDCTSLKNVTIPKGVKKIKSCVFYGCTSLKNVTIPKSVTSIGVESFGQYYNKKAQKNVKVSGFKITCYYDSAAGVYARKNKIACKYIDYIGNNKIKLSKTSYTYSGKAIKPTVTIMCGKTKLKCGKDYTYTYKNNKAVGTATVVIKGKGKYNGTKNVTFKINPKK